MFLEFIELYLEMRAGLRVRPVLISDAKEMANDIRSTARLRPSKVRSLDIKIAQDSN